ncbi:quinoprotein relay system zinc metallohydrolase 2 [Paracoccus homiensis]|uniref:quinoprotein relay system zinc metallohydrolase 2 n=1 Tax=Paracoccus homiensis TaxID=364199 RepID=UPI00398CA436
MIHLILTACLATQPGACGPILLPQGQADDMQSCQNGADRISRNWLSDHPELAGQATTCLPADKLPTLKLDQIAPGVFVHLGETRQLEDSDNGQIANLGVVVGDLSVAVIDAGVSRIQGQMLYAALRQITDKPISHLILTHMHPDHVLGASVFAEAGAQIWGHHALPNSLTFRQDRYLENLARLYSPQAMIGTRVVLPDHAVREAAQIDLGGRVLSLIPARTAHTDNDLMVRDDREQVLFAGDLVFRDLTPVVDGSLTGWLDWHRLPPSPMPRLIVPGHGPVAQDWESAIGPQRAFLVALADATRAQIAAGKPMSAAVPQIAQDLAPFEPGWNAFAPTVARDATAAFKELEWE